MLSTESLAALPGLMREAIEFGTEVSLSRALQRPGLWKAEEPFHALLEARVQPSA